MTDPKRYARAHDVTRSMIEGRPMPEAPVEEIHTSDLVDHVEGNPWAFVDVSCLYVCTECDDGGWVQVYGPNPPAFDVCPTCHNPNGHPSP